MGYSVTGEYFEVSHRSVTESFRSCHCSQPLDSHGCVLRADGRGALACFLPPHFSPCVPTFVCGFMYMYVGGNVGGGPQVSFPRCHLYFSFETESLIGLEFVIGTRLISRRMPGITCQCCDRRCGTMPGLVFFF